MVDEIKIIHLLSKLTLCIKDVDDEKDLSMCEILSAVTTLHMHCLKSSGGENATNLYEQIKQILLKMNGIKLHMNN